MHTVVGHLAPHCTACGLSVIDPRYALACAGKRQLALDLGSEATEVHIEPSPAAVERGFVAKYPPSLRESVTAIRARAGLLRKSS